MLVELFRTNLFLADSDSVNTLYNEEAYKQKFKSAVLMAKSIGLNPNMIIDSKGFESIVSDPIIKNFFINKIIDSDKAGYDYSIKVHVFGDFLCDDYFNNYSNENCFRNYYNEKIKNPEYFFSSLNCTRKQLESNTILKDKFNNKLMLLDSFKKDIYEATGKNIFSTNKNSIISLRESILNKITYIFKNINSEEYSDDFKKDYIKILTIYKDFINNDTKITDRSHFYDLLKHKELINTSNTKIINSLKTDIVDITYNSLFIKKDEIFRFKNIPKIDNVYSIVFDSYAKDGFMAKALRLYSEFDKMKSKFEIIDLALTMDPVKIINYLTDELMDKAEDKRMGVIHKAASYIIPKAKLLGISHSQNILIGVKS